MNVRVLAFAMPAEKLGNESVFTTECGPMVRDLLRTLCGEYSLLREDFFENTVELKQYVNIFKNGRNIAFISVLDTPPDAGDTIAIFPPRTGG